jgi:cell division protein ZapE
MNPATLTDLLAAPTAPDDLVPPPRFRDATFASYQVDAGIPGQAEAVAAVHVFASQSTGLLARWFSQRGKPGLYLDGSFGVGKTHLLAACFHEAATRGTCRYLSFSDAMSLMTMRGPEATADLLEADLVCLDEFELDDPTNTRLIDLLLGLLVARGARFVTTSNTVIGELGDGRMAIDLFRSQLVRISDGFQGVHVPGRDHRHLAVREGEDPPLWGPAIAPAEAADWLTLPANELDELLTGLPVANLRRLATSVRGVCILDLAPFTDQLAALRFVNLVDRLYDWCVPMRVRAGCRVSELFPEPPLRLAFHRKHRRSQSRLTELCA